MNEDDVGDGLGPRGGLGKVPLQLDDEDLDVVQRILLVTDGSVIHILEAYSGEPVEVVKLAQSLVPARTDEVLELGLADHEKVLRRTVLLRGRASLTPFVFVESTLVYDRLLPQVRAGLAGTNKAIGKLLRENRVETFREVVEMCRQAAGACAEHFGIEREATLIARTCHVVAGQRPLMTVTEKFPATAF